MGKILKEQESSGRLIAAICAGNNQYVEYAIVEGKNSISKFKIVVSAAPTALKKHGIGKGKSLTSYPAMKDTMTEGTVYKYMEQRVVVDGICICYNYNEYFQCLLDFCNVT